MLHSTRVSKNIPNVHSTYVARSDDLSPDLTADILGAADRYKSADRTLKAGCDLFRLGERGDAIYSLVDGWIALYNLLEDGRKQIIQFSIPGAMLAFIPARGATMNYSAQALTDVVVGIITHENLSRLAKDNPEVGMQLAGLISRDRGLAYDHLSSMGWRSARERVAYLLLELFIRSRLRWPGCRGEEMYLPLTQEHIGNATGLTGVHVNRVLRDLRKEGIAEFHYRRLQILNPDKLVDIAGIDPQLALAWISDDSLNETVAERRAKRELSAPVRLDAVRPLGVPPICRSAPPGRRRILGGVHAT